MTAEEKQAYHHGNLRNALITAADQIVREKGIEGFSLREAARRANVSPAAPFHHFGSIRGLLTEVAVLGYEELGRYLASAAENTAPARAMRLAAMAYIRFALDHPGRFRLMFRNDLVDRSSDRYQSASAQALKDFALTAQRVVGTSGSDRVTVFAEWSRVHGMAHLTLEGKAQLLFGCDDLSSVVERHLPDLMATIWPDEPEK